MNELPIMPIRAKYSDKASGVDSTGATSGQVLTADGNGESLWQDATSGDIDPSKINAGDILQNAVLGLDEDNKLVKGSLTGKYVEIMQPPESTTLTEEEQEKIKNGVFIEGDFTNLKNPIFFPSGILSAGDRFFGVSCGIDISDRAKNRLTFRAYILGNENKVLSPNVPLLILDPQSEVVKVPVTFELYGKRIPAYPTDQANKTYVPKLVNGELQWVEETTE